jgi:hypothetical protein
MWRCTFPRPFLPGMMRATGMRIARDLAGGVARAIVPRSGDETPDVATVRVLQALEGVFGPNPTFYLDPTCVLEAGSDFVTGATNVADTLRRIAKGARDIRVDLWDGGAVTTWRVPDANGAHIVCRFAVSDGRVTSIHAERQST